MMYEISLLLIGAYLGIGIFLVAVAYMDEVIYKGSILKQAEQVALLILAWPLGFITNV